MKPCSAHFVLQTVPRMSYFALRVALAFLFMWVPAAGVLSSSLPPAPPPPDIAPQPVWIEPCQADPYIGLNCLIMGAPSLELSAHRSAQRPYMRTSVPPLPACAQLGPSTSSLWPPGASTISSSGYARLADVVMH
eukprot:4269907-Prymnesium_polylepis.1